MNLLLLILLRAWSFLVRKFRTMADARGKRGFPLIEFVYLGTSLLGSALLARYVMSMIDPHAQAKKQVAKKAKEVERRLGQSMQDITAHEMLAVELVVDPKQIDVTIDDIGGLDDIMDRLVTQMEGPLKRPEVYNSGLLKHPKGVLLYGPPGTGKTMMAKALAKECDAFFLAVQPSSIQSKWYGDTNKAIGGIFKLARRLSQGDHACVIFIDEVDALLGKRKEHEHEVSLSMKTEFMSLWDGMDTDLTSKVVVMGATNRPQELDNAVLRRFTVSIPVELPDTAAREDIILTHLRQHCREHMLGNSAVEHNLMENLAQASLGGKRAAQWIAEQTNGYSGADLHELATEAARHSVQSMSSALSGLRSRRANRQGAPPQPQPTSQPPLSLADFQAALRLYQPTQQKAESFQPVSSGDMSHAMAAVMATLSRASFAANGYGAPHANNGSSGHANGNVEDNTDNDGVDV